MLATAFAPEVMPRKIEKLHRASRPAMLDEVMQESTVRTFENKEHIFRQGDPVTNVYRVDVGHVCIYKMTADGRRQVIDFAYPGDMIGLGAIGEHTANAVATSRTRAHCLPVSELRQVMRDDASLGIRIYEAMAEELSAARELLFTVTQRTASERVASFLIALARRQARGGGDASEFVLPMTRSDIADFLGLTIETVSRTFTKLRNEGLIRLEHSVLVRIIDKPGLEALAEGEGS